MNAQQLKNSILQEAIEGRLVPHDPNDEPASVLLDKIRKEKAQLVKAGKLKKKDLEETPITEDEKLFKIPESWEWVRIKTILNVYSARRVHEKDWRKTGIPFYRAREIGKLADSGFVNNDLYIEQALYDEFSKSGVPQAGDLMITAVGTLGKVYIVRDEDMFYYKDGSVLCMNNYGSLDPQYLKFYIESPMFKSQYQPESQGTTVATLTMVRVNEYMIPLPPLAEQHRIVARIEELLPKVEEYGKAQETLDRLNAELPERLKKSILQEAIEGRLVPQDPNDEPASALLDRIRKEKAQLVKAGKLKKKDLDESPIAEDEKPFEIPESWEWVRISDVVNVLMGQSPDGNDVFEAKEGDKAYEFHQGKICFTEKYITPSGKWCKFPSRIANKDSLLICVRAPIGDVNITQRSIGIGRGLAAMEGMGNISNMFLFYWMLAHKRCLEDQGTGSTFKAITVEVLKNQKIPLPPLAEQHRIVAKIEQLFTEIDKLKQ